jgi:hypothetical protein
MPAELLYKDMSKKTLFHYLRVFVDTCPQNFLKVLIRLKGIAFSKTNVSVDKHIILYRL